MNIIRRDNMVEPKALTVADMAPGTVYRVWSPFDGSKPDDGAGQVCLKLQNDEVLILAMRFDAVACPSVFVLALTTSRSLCGHSSVRVVEVYGELTGVEVAPV